MPTIIYICFKREDDFYQVLFSIFSLEKKTTFFKHENHQVIIYTDNELFFKKYLQSKHHNIKCILLSDEQIFELKGGQSFQMVFRVKLKLIERTLIETQNSVLYLDADTFFVSDFMKVLPSKQYSGFHCDEGLIKGRRTKETAWNIINEYSKFFENIDSIRMFNAGLIFVHKENISFVQNAIEKLDIIYPKTNFYFLEQLLISYELQKNTEIITFENSINHYWYIKEFTKRIKEFVELQEESCLENKTIGNLPIGNVPMEKKFRSVCYQWPYKIRRKLYQWGIISAINKF